MTALRRLGAAARTHPLTVDAGIALLCLVGLLLPLLVHADACGCPPIPGWAYALVLAQSLPLAWRRRAPFTVSLVVGLAAGAHGIAPLPEPPLPFGALIGFYTAAAYASPLLSYVTLAIGAVAIPVGVLVSVGRSDMLDYAFNYLAFGASWLLGYSARTRRAYTAEVERRATELERTRDAEAARAVAEERTRIARELHDVIAHHVSMMVIQAEAGPVVVNDRPAAAVQAFESISTTGRQALTEMRRLLGVLRDGNPHGSEPPLAPQPSLDRLDELVAQQRAAGLDVDLRTEGEPRALPPSVELSAYRLIQEALTNVRRHSGAARARVVVRYRVDALDLEIVDPGPGRSATPNGAGHGLVGMRERVALLGGTIVAGPLPGGGYGVRARLPLSATVPV